MTLVRILPEAEEKLRAAAANYETQQRGFGRDIILVVSEHSLEPRPERLALNGSP